MKSINPTKRRRISVMLAASGLMIMLLIGNMVVSDDNKASSNETATAMPSAEEDARECPGTWIIVQVDHEDTNRWFADGVQEIKEADTPEEAREAAATWLSKVRRDPELLAGASAYFLDDRKVDPSTLVDEKCATAAAEMLTAEIELTIAQSDVTPDEAPANGTNSGTDDNGEVTSASTPGVSGDTTAIKIVTKDGTTIWIMARCGNPVVMGPAPVPPGPTDNPPTTTTTIPPGEPKCPWNPALPPDHPNCLKPKNPNESTLVNPDVPDQVKGPGTTPIGTDPGPPSDPCDTPTGYCPGQEPTTTTTQPPGGGNGGSTTTTVPSCGQSGQPSCNNTGVTTPTTVAPPPSPPTTQSPTVTVPSP